MEGEEHSKPLLGSAAIAIAIKAGNVNIAGAMRTEVLDLSEESQEAMQQHAEKLRRFEAQQRARSIIVPTAIEDVKKMLREMNHPVTMFGENHADRRERLREVIASLELSEEEIKKTQKLVNEISKAAPVPGGLAMPSGYSEHLKSVASSGAGANQKEVIYTPASESLIATRKMVCEFSCEKSVARILGTKRIRASEEAQAEEDRVAASLYLNAKDVMLNSSQFGDERPITSVRFSPSGNILASSSLSGLVRLWDYSSMQALTGTAGSLRGHEERVTSLCWHPQAFLDDSAAILASSSADGTCILWDVRTASASSSLEGEGEAPMSLSEMDHGVLMTDSTSSSQPLIQQKLKGHQGAVSDCDFHPSGRIIGTAGHDYTWRLWDVETGEELLLQDGHIKEVGTLSFQYDGSLVLTADWAGVALLWDLRSGQSIQSFQGHIKKIVTSCFSPNGFQVATAGADNMVRIWDLRKKKCGYALPAHSNLISDVRYSKSGELLLTSSFDGLVKLWNARDFEPLRSLSGHTGKVMACDISPDERHLASAGYDRTLKKWTHDTEL